MVLLDGKRDPWLLPFVSRPRKTTGLGREVVLAGNSLKLVIRSNSGQHPRCPPLGTPGTKALEGKDGKTSPHRHTPGQSQQTSF